MGNDTMAQFFGSLGALAEPVQALARGGVDFGAAGQAQDASRAMSIILQQYAVLSAEGERLRQVLVAGGRVPCDIWNAYNQACLDYLAKSQPVFDQLAQKGVTVDQVVYQNGQPVPDPSAPGQYKTLRVAAPLRPPGFGFSATQCPGIANFQGTFRGGWTPVPVEDNISLGSVPASVLSALGTGALLFLTSLSGTPIGAAGYGAFKTYQQLSVVLEAYYDPPARIVAAYTECFEKSVKAGMPAAQASSTCAQVQTSAQQYAQSKASGSSDSSWGFWMWVGVGGAVLLAGGLLALYLRGRVSRALGPAHIFVPGIGGAFDRNAVYPTTRLMGNRKARQQGVPVLLGDLYLHPRIPENGQGHS